MQTVPVREPSAAAASSSHPSGLYLLFATEMWERFSYYGMRAVLVLFLTKAMMMDKAFASKFYGGYTSLIFLTPLIGGYISDRYWGNRRSILVGGFLMAIGQFTLFFAASDFGSAAEHPLSHQLLYLGLGFMILGNGFFKPNISSMVGTLYAPSDKRKDAAYTIFYMGINLGSLLGNLITSFVGDKDGHPELFRWAFLACGIAMVLSTVVFQWGKTKYLHTPEGEQVGDTPAKSGSINGIYMLLPVLLAALIGVLYLDSAKFSTIVPLLLVATVGIVILVLTDKSLTSADIQRVLVIFIVSFFVVFFWAAFEQAPASLTFFADEQMNRTILTSIQFGTDEAGQPKYGYTLPSSFFQILNGLFVVICAPFMAMLWTALGRRNAEPASPVKMVIGLVLLALGYIVMCFCVRNLQPGVKSSMIYLFVLYFLHSIGELCLSPIGLSLVNKLAPVKFASLLMAVWFLANAGANYLAGYMSSLYPEAGKPNPVLLGFEIDSLYSFFLVFVFSSAVAAGLLFLLSGKLARMMRTPDAPAVAG